MAGISGMEQKLAAIRVNHNGQDVIVLMYVNMGPGVTFAKAKHEAIKVVTGEFKTSATWMGWFDQYQASGSTLFVQ